MKKRFVLFLVFLMVIAGVWCVSLRQAGSSAEGGDTGSVGDQSGPCSTGQGKRSKKRRKRLQARLSASRQTGCCGR